MLWRLISIFLYYSLLVEEGRNLQEIPPLHSGIRFTTTASADLCAYPASPFRPVISENGIGFVRHRVEMEFDEEQFVGGGVFLAHLDILGHYAC